VEPIVIKPTKFFTTAYCPGDFFDFLANVFFCFIPSITYTTLKNSGIYHVYSPTDRHVHYAWYHGTFSMVVYNSAITQRFDKKLKLYRCNFTPLLTLLQCDLVTCFALLYEIKRLLCFFIRSHTIIRFFISRLCFHDATIILCFYSATKAAKLRNNYAVRRPISLNLFNFSS